MEKDYLREGIDITLGDKEVKKRLDTLKKTRFNDSSIDMSFILGFEKGCLIKDEENEKINRENIDKINKVDTDILLCILQDIEPLMTYLKNNKNDVYIKHKIINLICEINNYLSEVLNESESV